MWALNDPRRDRDPNVRQESSRAFDHVLDGVVIDSVLDNTLDKVLNAEFCHFKHATSFDVRNKLDRTSSKHNDGLYSNFILNTPQEL
ncbi:hypothetical protein LTR85_004216 [Meristemomyces frigidus]|nr:hypothetical protein LTR85_004216 [Meristemomyces frigidus]